MLHEEVSRCSNAGWMSSTCLSSELLVLSVFGFSSVPRRSIFSVDDILFSSSR